MRVSLEDLRRVRPGVLRDVAGLLLVERILLEQLLRDLIAARAATANWTGAAATAAATEREGLVAEVQEFCRAIGTSRDALLRAADDLEQAQALARRAEALAADAGGRVEAGGRLLVPPRMLPADDLVLAAAGEREEQRLRWEVETLVARALEEASTADRELARALTEAVSDAACFPASPAGPVQPPPSPVAGRPAEELAFANAAWWHVLTRAEQEWAIAQHPYWVGPRDGIPAADRHAANLLLLARAEREAAAALAAVPERAVPDGILGVGLHGGVVRLRERQRVAELAAVRHVLEQADGAPRRLLLLDASGPLVEAAIAVGDVDRAEHVATFVGGFTTTARDLPKYDRRFTRMRAAAREDHGADLAIVTWMGYPAPQPRDALVPGGRSVLSDRLARDNAPALSAFANGLASARTGRVHQTLWAHSYGSVLGGHALRRNTGFEDVVLFGSPGVSFTSLWEAGLKPGSLNVLRARWDVVAYSGWHLTDPAHVPGASLLSSGWSKPDGVNAALPSTGHSEYLEAGTTSEHNLIAVAIGRPDLRIPGD